MIKGNNEKRTDEYRRTRLLMFTLVRLLGDPKTAPKTPEALWQLPGDEETGISEDEIREMFKRIQK